MARNTKIRRAYSFFVAAEEKGSVFTLRDIEEATGWKPSTIDGYRTKKWHSFLRKADKGFICAGVSTITEDSFVRLHTQKISLSRSILIPSYSEDVLAHLNKSREAALMAVQIFNNPLITFRSHGYIVIMIIAYTSLFHAIFERESIAYYTYKTGRKVEWYWQLDECIKQYYFRNGEKLTEKDKATIKNLELFIPLRHEIEHRYLPEIDLYISGYAQALLLNYENLLLKDFGEHFSIGKDVALALQISEFSEDRISALNKTQATHFETISKIIREYNSKLPIDILGSQSYCFRAWLYPKTGKISNSDIALEFIKGTDALEGVKKEIAVTIEKQVQVAHQGMLRAKDVVARVEELTGKKFGMANHIRAWKKI